MVQVIDSPFPCRFAALPANACESEFFTFDFRSGRACPKFKLGKAVALDDPIQSAVLLGWINGIADIKK
jgi:hypothetical protein